MSSRRKAAGQRAAKSGNKKEPPATAKGSGINIDCQLGEASELSGLKNYVSENLERMKADMDQGVAAATKDLDNSAMKLRKRAKLDKATMQAAATKIEDHFRQYANDSAEDIQEVKTASESLQLKCRPGVTLTTRLLPELLRTFESNLQSLATKYDPTI